jgi:IS30 family transposase
MVLETAEQTPQDVEAIQRLSAAGWGRRRMARELGCSPETVRKFLRQRFLAHCGNADVA